jgi:hypothetical protein
MKQISIKEVLNHLNNGVTRTTDTRGYVSEIGSIEEKYELTKAEIKEMFKHPLLLNKKTRPPKSFVLIDDVTPRTEEVNLNTAATQQPAVESVTTVDSGVLTQDELA